MNKETCGLEQFSALIDSYQHLVFSICYRMTSDYFASEDLTQDTFLSAYQHMSSFDGANAKAWVCRIATNKCIDYLKRAGARSVPTSDEELENSMSANNDSVGSSHRSFANPEAIAIEDEVRATLLARCNKLKPPYDEVAKLYFYDEMKMPDIAKMRNLNLKTIQTQVYRAREMLKKQYGKERDDE